MKRFLTALIVSVSLALSACTYTASFFHEPTVGSTVKIEVGGGHGSGVHLESGYILTAAHVINAASEVTVLTQDGLKQFGKVLWVDKEADLALVKIGAYDNLKIKEVACINPEKNSEIVAHGNPQELSFITSHGWVAGDPIKYDPWEQVQTVDMSVLPGMSGGPVYQDGKVVGIVVGLKLFPLRTDVFSPPTPNITGFGFVVPGKKICEVMKEHG